MESEITTKRKGRRELITGNEKDAEKKRGESRD